tara:strand:+ start:4079 stop:5080 length:1002 start_codon:yes stop_codon:yes gene_type:complete
MSLELQMMSSFVMQNNSAAENLILKDRFADKIFQEADSVFAFGGGGRTRDFLSIKKEEFFKDLSKKQQDYMLYYINEYCIYYLVPIILYTFDKFKTLMRINDVFLVKDYNIDEYKTIGQMITKPYIEENSFMDTYKQNFKVGLIDSEEYKNGFIDQSVVDRCCNFIFKRVCQMSLDDIVRAFPLLTFQKLQNDIKSKSFKVYLKNIYQFYIKLKDRLKNEKFAISIIYEPNVKMMFKVNESSKVFWEQFEVALRNAVINNTIIKLNVYIDKEMKMGKKNYFSTLYDSFEVDAIMDVVERDDIEDIKELEDVEIDKNNTYLKERRINLLKKEFN